MPVRRGSIYLANFNPSKGTEPGKVRPCLVMQSDLLTEAGHPSTTVLPLTTQLLDDAAPLRYRINTRDQLRADSDIMLDQARTIDNSRFMEGLLTVLTDKELAEVETYWRIVMALD
jgi:mRNA interferase MazF